MIRGIILSLLILCGHANAQYSSLGSTFDTSFAHAVALFGSDNWTCMRSMASGACGSLVTFVRYLDNPCDGVTQYDGVGAWVTASIAENPAVAKIYIPPGSTCIISPGSAFGFVNGASSSTTEVIKNPIVWAYGASVDRALIGGWTFYEDNTHEALIASVSAGATSVTVTDGNVSRISVGDLICINGLALQKGGFPPNQIFFDFVTVTGIVGNVVSFTQPLQFSYESTWPVIDTSPKQGPAIIYLMLPSWDINLRIFGLLIKPPVTTEIQFQGRNIYARDVTVRNADADISVGVSHFYENFHFDSMELDKMLWTATFSHSSGTFMIGQSASITYLIHDHSNYGVTNGWVFNNYFYGGRYGLIKAGPSGYGVGNSAYMNNAAASSTSGISIRSVLIFGNIEFIAGTLRISKTLSGYDEALGLFVPGHKYYMGDTDGSNNASQPTTFTISDTYSDADYQYFTMTNCAWGVAFSCTGAFPTPTCGSNPTCSLYVGYAAIPNGIIQVNTPAGTPDFTQYAAPSSP